MIACVTTDMLHFQHSEICLNVSTSVVALRHLMVLIMGINFNKSLN